MNRPNKLAIQNCYLSHAFDRHSTEQCNIVVNELIVLSGRSARMSFNKLATINTLKLINLIEDIIERV